MAHFIIPTRIIPGCIIGAGVAAAGMFPGLVAGIAFTSPSKLKAVHLLAIPLLAGVAWLIRSAWKKDAGDKKVAELSPRLFAVICTVCLVVGFATGIIVGTQLIE